MFLLNEILLFGSGRGQEAIDRLNWIFSLFAPHPGFRRAILAKYLGDTTRHAILRFWDRDEDFQAFRASPDGGYGRSKPAGIYDGEHVTTPLITYDEAFGNASGDFLVEVQQTVPAALWDEFLLQQKRVLDLLLKQTGFVWACQLRARDEDESLMLARFSTRGDFERLSESPEYCELLAPLPNTDTPVRTKCFEVLTDVSPPQ